MFMLTDTLECQLLECLRERLVLQVAWRYESPTAPWGFTAQGSSHTERESLPNTWGGFYAFHVSPELLRQVESLRNSHFTRCLFLFTTSMLQSVYDLPSSLQPAAVCGLRAFCFESWLSPIMKTVQIWWWSISSSIHTLRTRHSNRLLLSAADLLTTSFLPLTRNTDVGTTPRIWMIIIS